MILELRTVSRKTPADGKLEISEATARRLAARAGGLAVVVRNERGTGVVTSMPCGCAKVGAAHVHHFLVSELFRTLEPESRVRLDLEESAGEVHLVRHE